MIFGLVRCSVRSALVAVPVLFVAGGIGCSHGDTIGVIPVTGRVTYQGRPLADALVMFRPKDSSARVASGYTRSDGGFQLITSGARSGGAMPGNYDVLVSKFIQVDGSGIPLAKADGTDNPAAAPQEVFEKSLIPGKYNKPDRPLLTATVSEKENTFTFDLAD